MLETGTGVGLKNAVSLRNKTHLRPENRVGSIWSGKPRPHKKTATLPMGHAHGGNDLSAYISPLYQRYCT